MAATTKTQRVNALMSRFIKLYEDRYNRAPRFNRNTERWGFGYMLDDLGGQSMAVMEYYFSLNRKDHSSQDLLKNYHELQTWMEEDAKDEEDRRLLRERTKQRVEEYNKKWQQP